MDDFDNIEIPNNYHAPKDAPPVALHTSGELRSYAGIPAKGAVDRETARKLIHGYYACVSFTDANVGRLLDALQRTGLADNTIVVLWGDHGWQLGEHGMWNKHSCFETSMHSPLLISAPNETIMSGTRLPQLTEFIDVYPTLCELSGLETPDHCEGTSLVNLMANPDSTGKPYAIGRYKSGDTIRSNRYRFTEFRDNQDVATGRMLYDQDVDPDENLNIVNSQEQLAGKLAAQLRSKKGKPTK